MRKLSQKQLKINHIRTVEFSNIDKVVDKNINAIDKKLPESLHTTKKDKMYMNHHEAKMSLMKRAMTAPRTNPKIATLLAKKLNYVYIKRSARDAAADRWEDMSFHGAKITKPATPDEFNKDFKGLVNHGKFTKLTGGGIGIAGYKDILTARSNRIFDAKFNILDYLGSKAISYKHTMYSQTGDKEKRNRKLRNWGRDIHNNKDDQAVFNKIMNERKHYPAFQPAKSFKQLGIKPNDTKKLQIITDDTKDIVAAAKDPDMIHRQTKPLYAGQVGTWLGEITNINPITRKLMGIDTGHNLNNQIKNKNIQPYANNSIYNTTNHKHLNDQELKSRAYHLSLKSQAMSRVYKQNMSDKQTAKTHQKPVNFDKALHKAMSSINTTHQKDVRHNKIAHQQKINKQNKALDDALNVIIKRRKQQTKAAHHTHHTHHNGPSLE